MECWQDICMQSIHQLHHYCISAGNMKVKWNACYAIGNFMRNPVMFSMELRNFDWQSFVIPTLCKIIVDFPNFKVRINAAAALAVPETREYLGNYYLIIWSALLEALEQSDHITDFNEYQHRDNLVDQVQY